MSFLLRKHKVILTVLPFLIRECQKKEERIPLFTAEGIYFGSLIHSKEKQDVPFKWHRVHERSKRPFSLLVMRFLMTPLRESWAKRIFKVFVFVRSEKVVNLCTEWFCMHIYCLTVSIHTHTHNAQQQQHNSWRNWASSWDWASSWTE